MGTITLDSKQQRKAEILTRLLAGSLTTQEAAAHLGVTPRQARRLKSRYRSQGMASVPHGNQGRAPANRTASEVVSRITALAGPGGCLHDFNTCHLQEKLAAQHLTIGRSTLDRLLKEQGLRKPRKERPQSVRRRRERRAAEGMLLQIDASPHDWLEGRGPRLCLIGAIDDASSRVCYARFHSSENQMAYLLLLRTIATEQGLPMSFYHDKHTILRSPKEASIEEQLAGKQPMSQLQRVMHELGIESIAAHSPQAKGRIERLWKTLQDRLLKEMRLAGVCTMEAANAFLTGFVADFNAGFSRPAADPGPAWVALQAGIDLAYYFAVKEERMVKADHTLSFQGQCLQIVRAPGSASLSGKRVCVHVVPEGEIYLYQGKQRLEYRKVQTPVSKGKPQARTPVAPTARPEASATQRAWLYGFR